MVTTSNKRSARLRAAIYTRVSQDSRLGTTREGISVESQDRQSKSAAAEEGWELTGETYCDNDRSASPYAKKARDEWTRLLTDIAVGAFDVLIMWESSRGSRKLSEWAGFLESIRDRGILIHVVSHAQTYDVRKKRHWKILADDGVEAEYASHETSDRVSRVKAELREQGRPDGQYTFGWRRIYDPKTRALIEQIPDEAEAPFVIEVLDRVLAAEPLRQIALDLNQRNGLDEDDPRHAPLRRGSLWRPDTIRRTAMNPTHVGMIPRARFDSHGDIDGLLAAEWSPLISPRYRTGTEDEEQAFVAKWATAVRFLIDPARKKSRPGKAKYMLTGLLVCGECGGVMGVKSNQQGLRSYGCRGVYANGTPTGRNGCTGTKKLFADAFVMSLLEERIVMSDLIAPATAREDAAAAAAQARSDQLQQRLDEALEQAIIGEMSWDAYAKAEARLEPQIADARAEARESESVVLPVFEGFADLTRGMTAEEARPLVREMLAGMEVAQLRETIRGVFEDLRLRKGRRGVKVFDPARIVYRWRGCAVHAEAPWGESCTVACLSPQGA